MNSKITEMEKKITIHDVARAAGVSSSTASLALRNSNKVKEDTRTKIQALARGFGYTPNHIARKLVLQNSELIGVLVPEISNPYFSELVEYIEKHIREEGYHIILGITGRNIKEEAVLIENFQSKQTVEGVLICSAQEDPEWLLVESLKNTRIPYIFLGPEPSGHIDFIAGNDEVGAEKIVTHLIKLGHRKIAFFGEVPKVLGNKAREKGYEKALLKAGIKLDPELIIPTNQATIEEGKLGAHKLLEIKNKPTAIFAVNDWTAMGIMFELMRLGIRIPEDMAIVGYDNVELSKHLPIPLTTVDYDNEQIAKMAIKILFGYIRNKSSFLHQNGKKKIFIEPEIIVRQSCGSKIPSEERS